MKKKMIALVSTAILSISAAGVFLLPEQMSGLLFANTDYTCDLPDGFVEISEVISDAIENNDSIVQNTKMFRGTVTRRNGDYAYVQRVDQSKGVPYGIKVIGLNIEQYLFLYSFLTTLSNSNL